MNVDRAAPGPGGDGVHTVVGPDGEERLMCNPVAPGRDPQGAENPSEPPPTNPVLAQPQQVGKQTHPIIMIIKIIIVIIIIN